MNKRQRKKAMSNTPRQLTAQEAFDALAPYLERNGESLSYFINYRLIDGKWALYLHDSLGFKMISHNVKGYGVKSYAG